MAKQMSFAPPSGPSNAGKSGPWKRNLPSIFLIGGQSPCYTNSQVGLHGVRHGKTVRKTMLKTTNAMQNTRKTVRQTAKPCARVGEGIAKIDGISEKSLKFCAKFQNLQNLQFRIHGPNCKFAIRNSRPYWLENAEN
jgi:hypothetical protein